MSKCAGCRFWGEEIAAGMANRECRRRSPKAGPKRTTTRVFPFTRPDDWCGEFEDRADLPVLEEARPTDEFMLSWALSRVQRTHVSSVESKMRAVADERHGFLTFSSEAPKTRAFRVRGFKIKIYDGMPVDVVWAGVGGSPNLIPGDRLESVLTIQPRKSGEILIEGGPVLLHPNEALVVLRTPLNDRKIAVWVLLEVVSPSEMAWVRQ